MYEDLRAFIRLLEDEGQLLHYRHEVDPATDEVAIVSKKLAEDGGPAVLFDRVKGSGIPILMNLFGSYHRWALALGIAEEDVRSIWEKLYSSEQNPIPPRIVKSGPCKEVKLLGAEADLGKIPVPMVHSKDGGPFITWGITFTKDPETGRQNAGIYRMQVMGPRKTGIQISAGHDARVFWDRARAKGIEKVEAACVLGVDPAVSFAALSQVPYYEMEYAGGIRGAPVELVKCETNSINVPATAEIVLEGYIPTDHMEMEGPMGEYPGYYGDLQSKKPVFILTAITMRKDPVYHCVYIGKPLTETSYLDQINTMYVLDWVKRCAPWADVRDCYSPLYTGGYITFISMKKHHDWEPRNLIAGLIGAQRIKAKIVAVFDDDIDVRDINQVMWALSTRVRPIDDTLLFERVHMSTHDPSAFKDERGGGINMSHKLGIDATVPLGRYFPEEIKLDPELKARIDREWPATLKEGGFSPPAHQAKGQRPV